MADLNQLICANNVANTGFGSCYLDMDQIIGGFIVPNGYSLTAAELDDLITTLTADAKVATKLNRIYPAGNFVAITDNSEDLTIQTFGYGSKSVVKEGDYDWQFQFVKGGLCLHQALRSFNGNGNWSIIFYDAKFRLFGTTGAVSGSLYGIPTKMLWAMPWKPTDGSNVTSYMLRVVFEPSYINEDLAYFQAESTVADVAGLQDILLTLNSWTEATGVANVSVYSRCGTNLYEVYPTELALTAVWTAANASTGGAITVSSVTGVAATKTFSVTLLTTDPDFPAGTQGILLNLAAIATLEANGINGFESAGALTLPTTA